MDNSLSNTVDRKQILDTAEAAVQAAVAGIPTPAGSECSAPEVDGVFVTIRIDGALRGCIGYLELQGSFSETLSKAARKAATEDYRFPQIETDELDTMTVDVTLLGKSEPISDPMDFVLGTHGLILEAKSRRGLLLPQVPIEHQWDKEQFLEGLCKKALAAPDTWRSPEAHLSRFEGVVLKRDPDHLRSQSDRSTR